MSLYNMLFGVSQLAPVLLTALGTKPEDIPRFRDCYVETDGDEPRIVIHTRTGGGNRDFYESEARCRACYPEDFTREQPPSGPWNSDLRNLPGFLYDRDDDYDCTYADFYFRVPPEWKGMIDTLVGISGTEGKPAERWQKLLDDLRSGTQTPETVRALAVGEAILPKIAELGQ